MILTLWHTDNISLTHQAHFLCLRLNTQTYNARMKFELRRGEFTSDIPHINAYIDLSSWYMVNTDFLSYVYTRRVMLWALESMQCK